MRRKNILIWRLLVCTLAPFCGAESQVQYLALGQGGRDWREVGDEFIGLDDAAIQGSLQPFELDPLVNLAVGTQTESGQFTRS